MIKQFINGRVYVFIDAANILYNINIKKLKDFIAYYK